MKAALAVLTFFMSVSTYASPARSIEGLYSVVEGCKPTNSRLGVLGMMYSEGTQVMIEANPSAGTLMFSADHSTLSLPLSSDINVRPLYFEDYYSNAEINVSEDTYTLHTQGSEMGICTGHPIKVKYPCLRKWNDAIGLKATAQGQLKVRWQFENATGSCLLQRLQ